MTVLRCASASSAARLLSAQRRPTSASTSAAGARLGARRERARELEHTRPARTARGGDHPGAARAGDISGRARGLMA